MEGQAEGRTDRPYFIGQFRPRLGVQKCKNEEELLVEQAELKLTRVLPLTTCNWSYLNNRLRLPEKQQALEKYSFYYQ